MPRLDFVGPVPVYQCDDPHEPLHCNDERDFDENRGQSFLQNIYEVFLNELSVEI